MPAVITASCSMFVFVLLLVLQRFGSQYFAPCYSRTGDHVFRCEQSRLHAIVGEVSVSLVAQLFQAQCKIEPASWCTYTRQTLATCRGAPQRLHHWPTSPGDNILHQTCIVMSVMTCCWACYRCRTSLPTTQSMRKHTHMHETFLSDKDIE